jgi:hypothetical protein
MSTPAVKKPNAWFRKPRRRLLGMIAVAALLVAAGELGARLGLGLGDPPLSIAYPDLEYAFRSGTYRRFGNTVHINSHHMRSPELSKSKTRYNEVRVMLMGDSVINGGALTDQSQLASELLSDRLATDLNQPVVVGNISAGSWGPGNLLAYARRFGLFDADIVVIVVNSEDATDNPTDTAVVGIDPSFPDRRPVSAIGEAIERYVTPVIRSALRKPSPLTTTQQDNDAAIARGLADLSDLCDLAASAGAEVVILHFPNRGELRGPMFRGHDAIMRLAAAKTIPFIDLKAAVVASLAAGVDPYRPHDNIHPNDVGQRLIFEALLPKLLHMLASDREAAPR